MNFLASLRDFIGVPRYRGPCSEHFDGRRFCNQRAAPLTIPTLSRYRRECRFQPWEHRQNRPQALPPRLVKGADLHMTWINHATFLLQTQGVNLLTDPVWGDKTAPVPFSPNPRFRAPGLLFDALPPIDGVLLSHNHSDHCEIETLRALHDRHHATIYTGLGNRAFLKRHGLTRVVQMDWWQALPHTSDLKLHFVPAQHNSRRGIFDLNRSLWGGFVIEPSHAGALYFAGDTGFGPQFKEIGARFQNLRVALLPIGGYKPRSLFCDIHLSPEEAVEAHKLLGARTTIPMHYGTFRLTGEGQDEPLQDLRAALARPANCGVIFSVLEQGEVLALA